MLYTYTPNQCPYQVSTFCTLQFLTYSPNKILKIKVTTPRSKVKSRSHHDVVHLQPLANVQTKYQHPTPYGFQEVAQKQIFKVKVTMARSNIKSRSHHDIPHLHRLTSVRTKYQLPTPYSFLDIARQDFQTQGHYGEVKGPIKVTPIPLNQCPYKVSTSYTS